MQEIDFNPAFEKIERVAKADGAEVEMIVERGEKFAASYQNGKPEKFDSSQSHCAGFRVISEGYEGYSYSENLSEDALLDAYKQALTNAKFTAKAEDPSRRVELASTADLGEVAENRELFNDSLATLDVDKKLERAKALEAIALKVDGRVSGVPYNGYTEAEGEVQILTSRGIRRRQRSTYVVGHSYVLAKQGEEARMAGESAFSRDSAQFDVEHIAKTAAEKAVAKLGAAPPDTGHYPVVIDAEVAAELIGLMTDYFSAKSVFLKESLFKDDLGKSIASPIVSFIDDPFVKDGAGTRAFDSEGAVSRVTPLIDGGVLKNFLTNSVYAKRMKLPMTGSAARSARSELGIGVSNLIAKQGSESLEKLLAKYPKMIYITDFSGYHAGFQESSGDFSLQSEGELWENGKRVRPLCNFVTAGNIRQLLKDVEALSSRRLKPTGSIICPDLLIKSLSIAGK